MNRETLFLAAGFSLFVLSTVSTQPPEKVEINSIEASDIGARVSVTGNTSTTYSTGEATFLEINGETGSIEGVSFNDVPDFEGYSSVTGRVDLYQGELQLIVDDVRPEFQRPVRN